VAAKGGNWFTQLAGDIFRTPAVQGFIGRQVSSVKDWTQKQITTAQDVVARIPVPTAAGNSPSPALPAAAPWLLGAGALLLVVLLVRRR